MAYRRGGPTLTPPSMLLFVISLVFAVISLLIYYGKFRIPIIEPRYFYELLLIGYIVLVVGVLFRRA